ncbi:Cytochrome c, mono-and diheme variants [Roseicitreum antarcticum]|uniref:Cytochrome c, mono-and diheme variants n=1 Tax=Roseicitreum antarcticum TaxID=564137 RepID=A0A1H3DVW4_9RHOB|nr:Cytochrome c, mono-and diheme variants [Roseicitreum antarcticum]
MIAASRCSQTHRLSITRRLPGRLLFPVVLSLIGLLPLPAAAFLHAEAQSDSGRELYVEHCAACHGVNLEGQPDWRSPDANDVFPAPPHDETGHTWHHDDAMLIDYITRGGQAVLDDMGVTFTSGMPGFSSVLDSHEIEAILDYIKSTWPEHIRDLQAQRSNAAAVD